MVNYGYVWACKRENSGDCFTTTKQAITVEPTGRNREMRMMWWGLREAVDLFRYHVKMTSKGENVVDIVRTTVLYMYDM